MSKELNEQQNATVGMTVGVIEVRFQRQMQPFGIWKLYEGNSVSQ